MRWKKEMLPLLAETMSSLAQELEELLTEAGCPDLAGQVTELRIVDRCRCGEDFCATMYARPRPVGAWRPEHFTIPLEPSEGMLIIDVVDAKIACIEVLCRDEFENFYISFCHDRHFLAIQNPFSVLR
jgi:hypothetical protein